MNTHKADVCHIDVGKKRLQMPCCASGEKLAEACTAGLVVSFCLVDFADASGYWAWFGFISSSFLERTGMVLAQNVKPLICGPLGYNFFFFFHFWTAYCLVTLWPCGVSRSMLSLFSWFVSVLCQCTICVCWQSASLASLFGNHAGLPSLISIMCLLSASVFVALSLQVVHCTVSLKTVLPSFECSFLYAECC